MKCRKCGAMLRDNDVFCAQCGWRVERENRYPRQETLDIPIADIEQNIIEETEKELGAFVRPVVRNHPKVNSVKKHQDEEYYRDPDKGYGDIKKNNDAREDYDDIEDDYVDLEEDGDYEDIDDEEDGEEEDDKSRLLTVLIAGMAFLILAIAAFAGFRIMQKIPIRNYGKGTVADEQDGEDTWQEEAGESEAAIGTIIIQSNVNVRDYPSTDGSQVLKVAKAGERYEYFGMSEDGSWYIVMLEDGSRAYIFKDYAYVE